MLGFIKCIHWIRNLGDNDAWDMFPGVQILVRVCYLEDSTGCRARNRCRAYQKAWTSEYMFLDDTQGITKIECIN